MGASVLGPDGTPIPPKAIDGIRRRASASAAYQASGFDHPALANWRPATYSGASAMAFGREFIAARIHDIARNDGWASAATDRVVDETIGSGWTLSAQVNATTLGLTRDEADEINDQIEALWADYGDNDWCDSERQTNQAGLLGLAMRHMFLDGEACAHVVWRGEEGTGEPIAPTGFATCLTIVDPGRLSNPNNQSDTEFLQQGVALDRFGAAEGYWIRRAHPGDRFIKPDGWIWDYVPREIDGRPEFIHAFRKRRAGERRGVGDLVSVLRKHKQVADIDDLEMQAISINSALAAFVTSPYDLDELVEAMDTGKVTEAMAQMTEQQGAYYKAVPLRFKDAQVNFLQPGEDVKLSQPQHPNANFEAFFRQSLRNIASAAGLTYEMLTMDWSNVNYSSARAALLVIYKALNTRKDHFAGQFMAPWYRAWLEEVFDQRRIRLPARAVSFEANPYGWAKAAWIGTGRGWIDPLREAEASGMRLSTGVSTLQDEVAEQGGDWKLKAQQRARERKFLIGLGLDPDAGRVEARIQSTSVTQSADPGQDIEDDVNGPADGEGKGKARRSRFARPSGAVPIIRRTA